MAFIMYKLRCLLLLFQHKRSRQLADYAKEAAGMNQEQLFQLLLQVRPLPSFSSTMIGTQVARLEQLLRGMYQKVLAARATQWDSLRADCVARMEELDSDDISGMLVFLTTVASFSALCWASSSSKGPVLLITFLLR